LFVGQIEIQFQGLITMAHY